MMTSLATRPSVYVLRDGRVWFIASFDTWTWAVVVAANLRLVFECPVFVAGIMQFAHQPLTETERRIECSVGAAA